MTPVSDSNLLCIMIEDHPQITAKIRSLMQCIESPEARLEFLLRECERVTKENEMLSAQVGQQDDAASLARSAANAYVNRH